MAGGNSSRAAVLITGAKGFLAARLAARAQHEGWEVIATDLGDDPHFSGISYIAADICDPAALKPALARAQCVVHAAGIVHRFKPTPQDEALFQRVNVEGTRQLAELAAEAGIQHFILVSSMSVYGSGNVLASEQSPCRPETPYARSKWAAENRVCEIARRTGMAATLLRLATLYGEEDKGNVFRLMRTIDRRRFLWIGDGANRKSLLHRDDACRAFLAVMAKAPVGTPIFNVGAEPDMMREIVGELERNLGKPVWPVRVPPGLILKPAAWLRRLGLNPGPLKRLDSMVQKWLSHDTLDSQLFQQAFQFKAQVPLVEGIRREVAWYREQRGKLRVGS